MRENKCVGCSHLVKYLKIILAFPFKSKSKEVLSIHADMNVTGIQLLKNELVYVADPHAYNQ